MQLGIKMHDVPCFCGHNSSTHHYMRKGDNFIGPCMGWFNDGLEMLECECKDFKQDNLKYLENLSVTTER